MFGAVVVCLLWWQDAIARTEADGLTTRALSACTKLSPAAGRAVPYLPCGGAALAAGAIVTAVASG